MLWLKGCLRCGGDLFEERDVYGSYVNCIQCGVILNEAEEQQLRVVSLKARKGPYVVVTMGPWALLKEEAA